VRIVPEEGLSTTSTGIADAARVAARSASAGDAAPVAVLLIPQYPVVPAPGPRTTTCPGMFVLVVM
jgi:hypothetical protein